MAYDEVRAAERSGNIILEGRERLSITGVTDVISFDEGEVLAETVLGLLMTSGEELHVERLSLEVGELVLTGKIDGLEYVGDRQQKGSFWSRLF